MLVTVAILIGGVVILQRAQIPHESPDERSTLSTVEADLPEGTAPVDSETDAPSLRLEIQLHGPCWVSAVADGERVVYRLMQTGRAHAG